MALWCDVFENQRLEDPASLQLPDPDYAGKDASRYPWLAGK
jgi:hypothetical protein